MSGFPWVSSLTYTERTRSDAPSGRPQQRGSWFGLFVCLWKQAPFCSASLANTLGVPHSSGAPFLLLEGVNSARTNPCLPELPLSIPGSLCFFFQGRTQRTGSTSDPTRERPVKAVVRKIPKVFFFLIFPFLLVFFFFLTKIIKTHATHL